MVVTYICWCPTIILSVPVVFDVRPDGVQRRSYPNKQEFMSRSACQSFRGNQISIGALSRHFQNSKPVVFELIPGMFLSLSWTGSKLAQCLNEEKLLDLLPLSILPLQGLECRLPKDRTYKGREPLSTFKKAYTSMVYSLESHIRVVGSPFLLQQASAVDLMRRASLKSVFQLLPLVKGEALHGATHAKVGVD